MSGNDAFRFWVWLRKHGCAPWFSGLTAWVGAAAGFLAAIYADRISHAFPFYNGLERHFTGYGQVDFHVALSYAMLFLFGCMFGFNSWAVTKTAELQIDDLKKHTSDLMTNTATLERVIRTLPPQNFLARFRGLLIDSFPVFVKGIEAAGSSEEIKGGILAVLSNLAFMAQYFDNERRERDDGQERDFCANVMLFRSFSGLSSDKILNYAKRAKFTERRGTKGNDWSGVLELIPDLAVFLRGDSIIVDEVSLPSFVLEIPLPEDRRDNGRSAVLPGGPEAFCEGGVSYCPDTHLMGNTCRRERAFRSGVAMAMDQYFKAGQGQDVRSFMSIPLFPSGCEATQGDQPLGVVNIHCNQPEMLRSDAVELFMPLTAPNMLQLGRLVEKLLLIPGGPSISNT